MKDVATTSIKRLALDDDRASVGIARRFVLDALADWRLDAVGRLIDDVALVVSEMVTNVVLHAETEAELVVSLGQGGLRVEVHDGSPQPPVHKHRAELAGTGRGVGLIESLAVDWGFEPEGTGKVVWAAFGPSSDRAVRAG